MDIQGTLVIPSGSAVTCTAARVSIDGGTIQLNDGAVLRVKGIDVGASDSTIEFNGGRLAVVEGLITTDTGNLYLNGLGGDVVIDHVPTQWRRLFEYTNGKTGRTYVTGGNNFIVSFTRTNSLTRKTNDVAAGALVLQHGGRTEFKRGDGTGFYSMGNAGDGNLFAGREVKFGYGTILDMANVWHSMKSLTGAGAVKGSYIRFEVPQGETGKCLAQTADVNALRKWDDGVLEVFNASPTNLIVEAGEVRVLPRTQLGYSEFRLKIDGVGTPVRSGVKINSLALFSGADNITAQYESAAIAGQTSGYVDNFLDGTIDASWWYGYNAHGGKENPSFDEAYVDIRFNDRCIVTGYKLRTADTGGGDRPRAWRLFGRDANGEWELLDRRTDESLPSEDFEWSDIFAAAIPDDADSTTRCKALTMGSGTKLTVLSNATFVCDSFVPNGDEVFDFKPGSTVDFSSEDASGAASNVDFEIDSSFTLDGAFSKSGSGTLTLTGVPSSSGPSGIHVKEGVLAFRTAFLPWKYWKFAFGEIQPKSGGGDPKGTAVGEVAVYDVDGNRLNVTGTVTMARLSDASFGSGRHSQMYDGIVVDQNWGFIGQVPDPSDETTWVYTSFVLSDAAPAVAGYNLMSGGGGDWNCWPKRWKVYAKENESDDWVLVDSKTDATLPSSNLTWYNGGEPWYLATTQAVGAAAFQVSAPVEVDPDATLDLTRANATVISHLVVDGDAEGYGTIRGGTYAAEGTLEINIAESSLGRNAELPLVIADAAGPVSFTNWKVVINGVEKRGYKVSRLASGRLEVIPPV